MIFIIRTNKDLSYVSHCCSLPYRGSAHLVKYIQEQKIVMIQFVNRKLFYLVIFAVFFQISLLNIVFAQTKAQDNVAINTVGYGWANNSVNTKVFRKNSLVTFKDTQFIAFYNADRYVMLGKRNLNDTSWQLKRTPYQGNTTDAHNSISIMVDGSGYLHVAWDHHNNPLQYCRSIQPGSLELTDKMPMTGKFETSLSYPEFYKLSDGNLLFFYRDGGSGRGNLVINKYNTQTKQWAQLHSNLIDGEGKRNAYWQACVDNAGAIHISWVWRESPDVASNHDMCYARSKDGGVTWERSNGEKYQLPITAANAEYAFNISQNSELINQTSMSADEKENPFIVTYWRNEKEKVPQYRLVYRLNNKWQLLTLDFRSLPFSLSGEGTKRIPIARPQVMVKGSNKNVSVLIVFRDEERGNRVSAVTIKKIKKLKWKITDLTNGSVGSWEPTFDTELWKNKNVLNLFVQNVEQVDAEGVANIPPTLIQVLQWQPKF